MDITLKGNKHQRSSSILQITNNNNKKRNSNKNINIVDIEEINDKHQLLKTPQYKIYSHRQFIAIKNNSFKRWAISKLFLTDGLLLEKSRNTPDFENIWRHIYYDSESDDEIDPTKQELITMIRYRKELFKKIRKPARQDINPELTKRTSKLLLSEPSKRIKISVTTDKKLNRYEVDKSSYVNIHISNKQLNKN